MKHIIAASILAGALALPAAAFAADYTIMAPAAPGGGWDGSWIVSVGRSRRDPQDLRRTVAADEG